MFDSKRLERVIASALRSASDFMRHHPLAKGAGARDQRGREVCPLDPSAQSFSVEGALLRANAYTEWPIYREALKVLHQSAAEVSGGNATTAFEWVDRPETTMEDALTLIDHAIRNVDERSISGEAAHRERCWHALWIGRDNISDIELLVPALHHAARLGLARSPRNSEEAADTLRTQAARIHAWLRLTIIQGGHDTQDAVQNEAIADLLNALPEPWARALAQSLQDHSIWPPSSGRKIRVRYQ